MMDTYLELLDEYLKAPQGECGSLSDALTRAEEAILDNPPPGQRRGLLEFSPPDIDAAFGFGDLLDVFRAPPLSDVIETIPEDEWMDHINDPDGARLRPFIWDILNQGSVGSCASEGITGCVMCRREVKGMPQVKLNPYFAYGRVNGGYDGGSTLVDNLAFIQKYGVASQAVWPRSKGWRERPSDEAYANALRHRVLEVARIRNKREFGSALIFGMPVYFGYPGHAIFACDPIDRTRFRYANSWDESWGDEGFGTLSYSSIQWSYGAYAILSVTTPDDEV